MKRWRFASILVVVLICTTAIIFQDFKELLPFTVINSISINDDYTEHDARDIGAVNDGGGDITSNNENSEENGYENQTLDGTPPRDGSYILSAENIHVSEGENNVLVIKRKGDGRLPVDIKWEVEIAGEKYFKSTSGMGTLLPNLYTMWFSLRTRLTKEKEGDKVFRIKITDLNGRSSVIYTNVSLVGN